RVRANLGNALEKQGKLRAASQPLEEAADAARSIGWMARAGNLYSQAGVDSTLQTEDAPVDWKRAERLNRTAPDISTARPGGRSQGRDLATLGTIASHSGNKTEARTLLERAIEIASSLDDFDTVVRACANLEPIVESTEGARASIPYLRRALDAEVAQGHSARA